MKVSVSALVLVPPTVLMGMTFPLVVSVLRGVSKGRASKELRLYAANTLGGVLGLGWVIFGLLPWLGAAGSMIWMLGLNLVIAGICFWMDRGWVVARAMEHRGAAVESTGGGGQIVALMLAFASGAGVLAMEVLGLALANLSAPLSFYPQGSILGCVLLLLAAAAWVVSGVGAKVGEGGLWLGPALLAAALMTTVAPFLFLQLPRMGFGFFGYGQGLGQFLMGLVGGTLISMGPAYLCAGMIFPLLIRWHAGNGRCLGWLLAANGVGGVVGAEVAFRWMLPRFAVHVSFGLVGVCYALAALVPWVRSKHRSNGALLAIGGVVVLAVWMTGRVLTVLPVYFEAEQYHVVDLQSGREGSLAVVEDGRSRVMILDNQYTLGGTWVTPSLRRQAHIPLLLHPAPKRVALIGLGTGITGSGALEHSAVESITAVELSGLVARASARHFDEFNHGICRHPKARVVVEDARLYLRASAGAFDVIVGDLFTPWRPGEASLSSLEHFEVAHKSLNAGGVYCQWIELTQWTPEQLEMVLATFRKVFGHAYLFRTGFQTRSLPVGIVGFKTGVPSWDVVERRCRQEAGAAGQLEDPLCRHAAGVLMLYLGESASFTDLGAQVNTLDNLRLEITASRNVILEDSAEYFSGTNAAWLDFLDRQSALVAKDESLPLELRRYPGIGRQMARLELAFVQGAPEASSLARDIALQIPEVMKRDPRSKVSFWPGTIPPWNVGVAPMDPVGTAR